MITKSWLWLALFFYTITCPSSYGGEQQKKPLLHLNKQWQALLHLKDGKPQITDPKFILSHTDFSPESELLKTIEFIKANPQQAACRFPARYMFLSKYISLNTKTVLKAEQCKKLKKYIDYVPFDNVDLVFASEVIASASSMMGHTFIKVSGKNNNGDSVSHSVSFFTEFSSFNPISIFYDATISGMDGFFVVRPFTADIEQYVNKERRNLWNYQLALSDQEKTLLKLHIWELKDLDINYLFQSYNCATLTLYLLSITKPELRKQESLFVSPIDVAKAVNNQGIVNNKNVILSQAWEFNMLHNSLSEALHKPLKDFIFNKVPLNLALFDAKTQLVIKRYLFLLSKINPLLFSPESKIQQLLFQNIQTENFEKLKIDLSYYKNPINSPQDSAIGFSYLSQLDTNYLDFSFVPASHFLYGDNSQYFSESELKIGEITLRTDTRLSDLSLHSLILYSMKSFTPSTLLTPTLSGELFVGLKSVYDAKLEEQLVVELSGSIGKSYSLHKDIMIYTLLGGGIGLNKIDDGYAYLQPNIGLLINLVGSTKIKLDHKSTWGQIDAGSLKHTTSLTWSWYGIDNKIVSFYLSTHKSAHMKENTAQIKLDILF